MVQCIVHRIVHRMVHRSVNPARVPSLQAGGLMAPCALVAALFVVTAALLQLAAHLPDAAAAGGTDGAAQAVEGVEGAEGAGGAGGAGAPQSSLTGTAMQGGGNQGSAA